MKNHMSKYLEIMNEVGRLKSTHDKIEYLRKEYNHYAITKDQTSIVENRSLWLYYYHLLVLLAGAMRAAENIVRDWKPSTGYIAAQQTLNLKS